MWAPYYIGDPERDPNLENYPWAFGSAGFMADRAFRNGSRLFPALATASKLGLGFRVLGFIGFRVLTYKSL